MEMVISGTINRTKQQELNAASTYFDKHCHNKFNYLVDYTSLIVSRLYMHYSLDSLDASERIFRRENTLVTAML